MAGGAPPVRSLLTDRRILVATTCEGKPVSLSIVLLHENLPELTRYCLPQRLQCQLSLEATRAALNCHKQAPQQEAVLFSSLEMPQIVALRDVVTLCRHTQQRSTMLSTVPKSRYKHVSSRGYGLQDASFLIVAKSRIHSIPTAFPITLSTRL
jgi:hypothetical protein